MRRHFVFKEQEHEHSVGDHSGRNLLQLWLARRLEIQRDELVARHLVAFWDLAKGPRSALALCKTRYVAFFQCVAKALVQSVGNPAAVAMAPRDWLYDCRYVDEEEDPDGDAALMALEEFQDALFEVAELVLPVESAASMFASFFHELRDAIARRPSHSTAAAPGVDSASFASDWELRPLRDVAKIRGAFLQAMAPNRDHLAIISGLNAPDSEAMSLKQLLLAYNPRKLALSRQFSALVASAAAAPPSATSENQRPSLVAPSEPESATSSALNRRSEDAWDVEIAALDALSTFPALRVAVVGPPGSGKTRVAKALARRLDLQYVSLPSAIDDAIKRKRQRDHARALRLQERNAAKEAEAAAAAAAAEAEAAEAAAEGSSNAEAAVADDSGETPSSEAPPAPTTVEDDDPKDPEELLFGDDDLAALYQGQSLPYAKGIPLLIAYARRLLLRGIGVVIDDVHPSQVAHELSIDYLVLLEIARDDARERIATLRLAPIARRVYSQRELAMLEACDAVLEDRGWADRPRVEREASERESEGALQATVRTPRRKGDNAAEESPQETQEQENTEDGDHRQSAPQSALSVVERNDLEPLSEAPVPLGSLLLDAFSDRFREYEARVVRARVPDPSRTHVVRVLATQALSTVVQHCVFGITNVRFVLRFSLSHSLCILSLWCLLLVHPRTFACRVVASSGRRLVARGRRHREPRGSAPLAAVRRLDRCAGCLERRRLPVAASRSLAPALSLGAMLRCHVRYDWRRHCRRPGVRGSVSRESLSLRDGGRARRVLHAPTAVPSSRSTSTRVPAILPPLVAALERLDG
ncbi:hypothetical protein PINS_up000109 [Pythium insidiosum]|nr:hypothetical protein PINS_up000109 [Pythium insidiosum]